MRPDGQIKMGFYPIPSPVLSLICDRLVMIDPSRTYVLDPCCGNGAALAQIGRELCVPEGNLYGCELDGCRDSEARASMPAAHFPTDDKGRPGGPCAFESLTTSYNSFSLVYLNPPFDSEIGGGTREELAFAMRAYTLLVPQTGVLVFVAPFHVFNRNRSIAGLLDAQFERAELVTFPESHRQYGEAIYVGVRRKKTISVTDLDSRASDRVMTGNIYRPEKWTRDVSELPAYKVEPGQRPRRFVKTYFTGPELFHALAKSKLNRHLGPPQEQPLAAPGMTMSPGHQALFVTSGLADGVIRPEGELPFIVRGTVGKEEEVDTEKSGTDFETGTTKTVIVERITHTVRCITPDGEIHTFTTAAKQPADTV